MTVDFANLPDQPSFPAAESAVLGAVMLSATAADKLLPILREEHFTSTPHRDTLAAVRTLWERRQPIDPVLVHDQLRKDGHTKWGETKAALFIHECVEATYFPGNSTSYAAVVIECAVRRRVLQAGIRISQAAARGTGELSDLMSLVATEVHTIGDHVAMHQEISQPARAPVQVGAALTALRPELDRQRVAGAGPELAT